MITFTFLAFFTLFSVAILILKNNETTNKYSISKTKLPNFKITYVLRQGGFFVCFALPCSTYSNRNGKASDVINMPVFILLRPLKYVQNY